MSFTWCRCCSNILMRTHDTKRDARNATLDRPPRRSAISFTAIHHGFERGFERLREALSQQRRLGAVRSPWQTAAFFGVLMVVLAAAVSAARPGFLPAGRCRADAPACARAARHADRADAARFRPGRSRDPQIVGNGQIDTILDNIGLPYSGINIALERFGHRRTDGWRNPGLAEAEPHADGRPCRRSAARAAEAVSANCSSSSSPPTSSIRC